SNELMELAQVGQSCRSAAVSTWNLLRSFIQISSSELMELAQVSHTDQQQ
ncbi:hypothetical protein LSAT2_005184, partial [Lamellibrachia satsuma]